MKVVLKLLSQVLAKFKHIRWLLTAVGLLSLGIGLGIGYIVADTNDKPYFETALVINVIDGDTVELIDGRIVRYLGIDTPESGENFSVEATQLNQEYVEGKWVELQSGKRDKDDYGRFLRYVYVNGVFVNAQLVAQGYARAYIFDPYDRYSQVIVQLEQYAKLQKRGLWEEVPQ